MLIVQKQRLTHQNKHTTAWHQHASGQLFCIQRGMMIVKTEQAQWALTPATVGWFPAQMRHCAWSVGEVEGHSLQLNHDDAPAFAGVWPADPFMMLLMERITQCDPSRQASLLAVMMEEIRVAPGAPLQLTLPQDRRAKRVAELLLSEPHHAANQVQLAKLFGLSVRTLSRLFSEQTGLSFSQWRQQAKVLASMAHLLRGVSVSETAERCGYDNVSAFIAAFKLRFGSTPGQFQARNRAC
ncbi:AraC family transcriptional regulator [Kosakonia sacchari]|uniref:AraC family transcriptional regulator n=1 Tax=Kosakonia sacchari TaxID=1158459 RepID=UPI001362D913|nr:helix-turn-helix transcriptional regulator [Kosakonia sacchari]QHM93268.1 helix-turn-helix domain-containing protein [Kosakonia sacchari]